MHPNSFLVKVKLNELNVAKSSPSVPSGHVQAFNQCCRRTSHCHDCKSCERALSHAAWNTLPENLRAMVDPAMFRKQLKAHYFTLAFNVL